MRTLSVISALFLVVGLTACGDDDGGSNCTDADGDGYGVGDDCAGPDCDDTDDTVWEDQSLYADADDDGVYSDTAVTVCTDGTVPTGYSATAGTDCDDTDASAFETVQAYVDADGDGYGASDASAVDVCGPTLPANYADNNTDCDDASALVYGAVTGYMDLDGDGVSGTVQGTACTDGSMLPEGWTVAVGTDCDDLDPYSQVEGDDPGCEFAGVCADTEMAAGAPDLRGVGACQSVDCNGMDPACYDTTPTDQGVACEPATEAIDCEVDVGEWCLVDTCVAPRNCCENVVDGLTCSEIPGCLTTCQNDHAGDPAGTAQCLQFECIEGATPKAQYLYGLAQNCAAAAGCFAQADPQACASQNCLDVFVPCLSDVP